MQTLVGLSGAHRNTCVASLAADGYHGICELERIVRVRRAVLPRGATADAVLDLIDPGGRRDAAYVVAEEDVSPPASAQVHRLGHHEAHAATAFLTSPFEKAAIVVCDGHVPGVSVWTGEATDVSPLEWCWRGPSFTHLYATCAQALGFAPGQEHRMEALARVGDGIDVDAFPSVWRYIEGGGLEVRPGWEACLEQRARICGSSLATRARWAAAVHRQLGCLLLRLIREVKAVTGATAICLGGGLFFNSFFNTVVRDSKVFDETFVPVNPGNAGLAAGGVLAIANRISGHRAAAPSPFLGPSYSPDQIKATLDNCKATYTWCRDNELIEAAVDVLCAGGLVGWFDGRMEWGPRALGHRSILANPRSPYVLVNLNTFLKRCEPYRPYGLSVLAEEVDRLFEANGDAPCMEYEYRPRDPDLFKDIMPAGASVLRIQTLARTPSLFRDLHRAYAQMTGAGALVNTSFNCCHEPIACSPRDALRIFFSTGLDLLVLGRFLLRK